MATVWSGLSNIWIALGFLGFVIGTRALAKTRLQLAIAIVTFLAAAIVPSEIQRTATGVRVVKDIAELCGLMIWAVGSISFGILYLRTAEQEEEVEAEQETQREAAKPPRMWTVFLLLAVAVLVAYRHFRGGP
jgi:hypothetical protein